MSCCAEESSFLNMLMNSCLFPYCFYDYCPETHKKSSSFETRILKDRNIWKRKKILKMHKILKKIWRPSFSAKRSGSLKKVMSCEYSMNFWKKICSSSSSFLKKSCGKMTSLMKKTSATSFPYSAHLNV
jgi:hypothetical protein